MDVLLQYEVLPRLPLRELVRVRSVCKSWKSIISKPWFIKRHQALNPIPTNALLTYADSTQGTLRLDLDRAAWVRTPSLDCPTSPSGVLLAASGGLLCYGIIHSSAPLKVIKVDFVIWNPVTNRRTHLPTLHAPHPDCVIHPPSANKLPCVVMVVRQGELHQLWVNLFLAFAVFDCFISEESMQTRMACNPRMRPLPNSWIALWLRPEERTFCYLDSKIVFMGYFHVRTIDVDSFTVSDFPKNEEVWTFIDVILWKEKIAALAHSGRLACVCEVIIDTEKGGPVVLDPILPLGDRREFLLFQGAAGIGDYFYVTFIFANEGVLVHMGNKMQQEVELPDDKCRYARLFEPSLTDSPGSPCNVNFDWSGFQFPELTEREVENRELEWIFPWEFHYETQDYHLDMNDLTDHETDDETDEETNEESL